MTTVSQGPDSSAEVVAEAAQEIERAAAEYVRPTPVECTIRPVWFWALTITIVVIAAVSILAIWAGANFSGGEPGLTAPAGK